MKVKVQITETLVTTVEVDVDENADAAILAAYYRLPEKALQAREITDGRVTSVEVVDAREAVLPENITATTQDDMW